MPKIFKQINSVGKIISIEISESDFEMIGKRVTVLSGELSGEEALIIGTPHYNVDGDYSEPYWGLWPIKDKEEGYHTYLSAKRDQFKIKET